jgi:hypothetical protein
MLIDSLNKRRNIRAIVKLSNEIAARFQFILSVFQFVHIKAIYRACMIVVYVLTPRKIETGSVVEHMYVLGQHEYLSH